MLILVHILISLSSDTLQQVREYIAKLFRPLPKSGILKFGEWIYNEDWAGISEKYDPTEQVLAYHRD